MNSEIILLNRKYVLRDGEKVKKPGAIKLGNKNVIELPAPILSYLELQDRLIIVLNWYHASKLYNIFRNIFCYSKKDGSLIWQIEQPFDGSREDRPVLEEVFKYIALYIKGENEEWLSLEDSGTVVTRHKVENGNPIIGKTYNKPFRPGIDRLNTMTLAHFPNEYWVDYETGKLEWIRFHQKI